MPLYKSRLQEHKTRSNTGGKSGIAKWPPGINVVQAMMTSGRFRELTIVDGDRSALYANSEEIFEVEKQLDIYHSLTPSIEELEEEFKKHDTSPDGNFTFLGSVMAPEAEPYVDAFRLGYTLLSQEVYKGQQHILHVIEQSKSNLEQFYQVRIDFTNPIHLRLSILAKIRKQLFEWNKSNSMGVGQSPVRCGIQALLNDIDTEHESLIEKLREYSLPIWAEAKGIHPTALHEELEAIWMGVDDAIDFSALPEQHRKSLLSQIAQIAEKPLGRKLLLSTGRLAHGEKSLGYSPSEYDERGLACGVLNLASLYLPVWPRPEDLSFKGQTFAGNVHVAEQVHSMRQIKVKPQLAPHFQWNFKPPTETVHLYMPEMDYSKLWGFKATEDEDPQFALYPPFLHLANSLFAINDYAENPQVPVPARHVRMLDFENTLRGEYSLPKRKGIPIWAGEPNPDYVKNGLPPLKHYYWNRLRRKIHLPHFQEQMGMKVSRPEEISDFNSLYQVVIHAILRSGESVPEELSFSYVPEASKPKPDWTDDIKLKEFLLKNKRHVLSKYWEESMVASLKDEHDLDLELESPTAIIVGGEDEALPSNVVLINKLKEFLKDDSEELVDKLGASLFNSGKKEDAKSKEKDDKSKVKDSASSIGDEAKDLILPTEITEILSIVTNVIDAVKDSFVFIKDVVSDIAEIITEWDSLSAEDIIEKVFDRVKQLVETVKSILSATNEVLKIFGIASTGLATAIPALGIVISIIEIARRGFTLAQSIRNYVLMYRQHHKLFEKMKDDLIISKLLNADNEVDEQLLRSLRVQENFDEFFDSMKINRRASSIKRTLDEAGELDVCEELEAINRERIIKECIFIATNVVRVAANITTLAGVSAPVGIGLQIGASAVEGGMYLVRFGVQKFRDAGWGNQDMTTRAIHLHRLDVIKEVGRMIGSFDGKSELRADVIEAYVRATGTTLYKLSKAKNNEKRVLMVYNGMKERFW
ncbi:hypothetical protein [Aureibacter tunicatorum]|uniref:Uncharacterized protein n=1 Tax=Aureibacter tunicatorum TaxID=866807 RepID=A0AAE3XTT0_9BACT|nr:hypothetical protein [Aureibacter tunicatorum]MDR6241844.1 hypothetical protein [Aureibacter tunicatorum]BDD07091.1 hypothetical protein AUTU_45740 [Aureibacter tunicatorum]